jgi:hypothetical protein
VSFQQMVLFAVLVAGMGMFLQGNAVFMTMGVVLLLTRPRSGYSDHFRPSPTSEGGTAWFGKRWSWPPRRRWWR